MINCSADGRGPFICNTPPLFSLATTGFFFLLFFPLNFLNQQYAAANGKKQNINNSRDKPDLL
jgi:hypothetical protein